MASFPARRREKSEIEQKNDHFHTFDTFWGDWEDCRYVWGEVIRCLLDSDHTKFSDRIFETETIDQKFLK